MAKVYEIDAAFLPGGWARGVRVNVDDAGFITAICSGSGAIGNGQDPARPGPAVERIAGIVVPGMANAHSHAFQRAMAGNTELRRSSNDSFWTWRQAMYTLASHIEPDDLATVARQLYVEMLKAGYTTVAEFHYLHRQPDGRRYAEGSDLLDAIESAAAATGIGLTTLATLYQTSDFGAAPLRADQRRFHLASDEFLRMIESRRSTRHTAGGAEAALAPRAGAAFHSLRAVPLETLREIAAACRAIDAAMPIHIHAAEQRKEVEACLAATGRRPIELLLESGLLNEHWCLVHATHSTRSELHGIAAARANVCLSISTEANLGDGTFDAATFLRGDGRFCVGSDSQISVSPSEELRWMEYQQRLRKRRRAVLASGREPSVGSALWSAAARHGAAAIDQPAGALEEGRRADWLVLDSSHPSMAGAPLETSLDHLIFAGGAAAIRDVMVAGRWVVRDSHHPAELQAQQSFATLMNKLSQTK